MASGRVSAGLLMYRISEDEPEVFLAHPGGPYFAKKDAGSWSIPKGEPEPGEELLATAVREFAEETGITPPSTELIELGSITQKGGKEVHAWAFEGDWDPSMGLTCNDFEIEWPPRSGRRRRFPEIDRVEFFPLARAREKINSAQVRFIDRLVLRLDTSQR